MRLPRTSRERQSGATLVELLVSVVIIGIALALIVGAFSSGILQSTIAKRDTAASGIVQYEMEAVQGSPWSAGAVSYSDCFPIETAEGPVDATDTNGSTYQQPCPDSTYAMRADVALTAGPSGSQQWTITVVSWPALTPAGPPVSVLKVNR